MAVSLTLQVIWRLQFLMAHSFICFKIIMLRGSLSPCRLGVHPATVPLGQRLLPLLFRKSRKAGNTFENTEKAKQLMNISVLPEMRLAGTIFVSVNELFKSVILVYLRLVREVKLLSNLTCA